MIVDPLPITPHLTFANFFVNEIKRTVHACQSRLPLRFRLPLRLPVRSALRKWILLWASLYAMALGIASSIADEPTADTFTQDQLDYFENHVRPLLVEHCYECHSGTSSTVQGKLRLDSRAFAIRGGESGAAVVPGKPDESLLLSAVRWKGLEMPPDRKLSDVQLSALAKWVEMGAPWPGADGTDPTPQVPGEPSPSYDWSKWRTEHWAFQPIQKPSPPSVHNQSWVQSPVDQFLLAGLEANGLEPVRPADPRVLFRRIYFDLIGLPPTFEETVAFERAYTLAPSHAVSEAIDSLLASKQYGERWGRHWLDVARYSEGFGGFLDNASYENAWRYRDWVTDALSNDTPFHEFLRLQIAGDLIGDKTSAIATGFLALGPNYISDGGDPDSTAQARAETLSDRIDTLSQGMLGLTVACARCHDHKFDPLPQEDYYSLAGIFNNSATHEIPLATEEVVNAFRQHQGFIQAQEKTLEAARKEHREATDEEKKKELLERVRTEETQLEQLKKSSPPPYDKAHSLHETGTSDMAVAIRGNLLKPGPVVARRFLKILSADERTPFTNGSGRSQLADAIADPKNPLAARVFVNRVWMHHFGQALVRTPNNFGALGEKPTHPLLLDWLAASLLEKGSIKGLHRTIMMSSAYQLSSDMNEANFAIDGDNRFVWRANPRRMDAEVWRDSLLCVTGELDLSVGGPPSDNLESRRRTLYFKVSRNGDVFQTDEFLRLFDFPLMRTSVAKRPTSIVPQQYLFLLNSPFMQQRARALSERLAKEASTDSDRIERAYNLLYQRSATQPELSLGQGFLGKGQSDSDRTNLWEQYCQALLGSNEFMYLP
ncbi:MAG: PSD1 and planctomycete cytochrome C domain-containing protein [Pirellula sp.]